MMSLPLAPPSQILLMTIFLSTPRPRPRIKLSILTTGTSKYSDARSGQHSYSRIPQRLPSYSFLRHTQRLYHAPQDDTFPGFVSLPTCRKIAPLITRLPPGSLSGIISRISSHSRPSSESRQSMRCRPSDLSYSRSFVIPIPRLEYEWLGPSKQIGKSIFSGQAPHPNEVPSLFVEQKITSALPMAYYIAA